MTQPTPEQLGLKPDHITQSIRTPYVFSRLVMELASSPDSMRQCRDTMIAGINLIGAMSVMCAMDAEMVLKRIEEPDRELEAV